MHSCILHFDRSHLVYILVKGLSNSIHRQQINHEQNKSRGQGFKIKQFYHFPSDLGHLQREFYFFSILLYIFV